MDPNVGISDKELVALASIANELGVTSTLGPALTNDDMAKGKRPIDQLTLPGFDLGTPKNETIVVVDKSVALLLSGIDLGSFKATTALAFLPDEIDHGTHGSEAELSPLLNHQLSSLVPMDGVAHAMANQAPGLSLTLKPIANMDSGLILDVHTSEKVGTNAPNNVRTCVTDCTSGNHPAYLGAVGGSSHHRRSLPVGVANVEPDSSAKNDGIAPLSDSNQSTHNHKRPRYGKHCSSSSAKSLRSGTDLVDKMTEPVMNLETEEVSRQPHQGH
ncbi:hypothetical protein V6N13_032191 [Hibiscus sabdariffa]|uniref:Uncharacterized protein n=2 Tax=Hibiscus sabdariffa TaxID=183260 RepID=A0ABR2AVY8_9ROSI